MIARGAFYIMVSRVAFVLSGYAIHVSMAYLLTPADYGTLGVVVGLITLWRVFLSAGIPQTATRLIAGDQHQTYWIWRRALKVQILAALALWALYVAGTPIWVRLLSDSSLWSYILLSSPLIPLMAWYQANLAYFAGRMQFAWQALVISLYSIVRVVLAVVLVVIGMRVDGVVLGMTLAALLVAILTHGRIPREPRRTDVLPHWRELVAFSLPLVMVSFGISALLNLDLLLLKHFFPRSEILGYYNGAINLGKAPYWILSAFATTALPAVAKALGEGDADAARRMTERHASYVLLISLPCAALVFPSGARLLELVYPSAYSTAATPLVILVCSGSALAVLAVLTSVLTAAGRPHTAMGIVLVCTLAQGVLGAVLVPRYAMVGAATANLLTVAFGVIVSMTIVKRRFGGVLQLARVAKAAGVSAVLAIAFSLWQTYPPLALPFLYCLGLVLYGAAMLAVGGWTSSELRALKRLAGMGEAAVPAQGPLS